MLAKHNCVVENFTHNSDIIIFKMTARVIDSQ